MTKKDYIKLAKCINQYYIGDSQFIHKLCEILQGDNPLFDKQKFLSACGFTDLEDNHK